MEMEREGGEDQPIMEHPSYMPLLTPLVSCNVPLSVYPARIFGFPTLFFTPCHRKGPSHGFLKPSLGGTEFSTTHSLARQSAQARILDPTTPRTARRLKSASRTSRSSETASCPDGRGAKEKRKSGTMTTTITGSPITRIRTTNHKAPAGRPHRRKSFFRCRSTLDGV